MNSLDPLHISLIATTGLVSLLLTIVAFFLARDFRARDERDKQLVGALSGIQGALTIHEGLIAKNSARIDSVESLAERTDKTAQEAFRIANNLQGRLQASGGT